MNSFIQRHRDLVIGQLNGWDRLRFRGSKRLLCTLGGMMSYLWQIQVPNKGFKDYALAMTDQLRRATVQVAEEGALLGQQFGRQGAEGPFDRSPARRAGRIDRHLFGHGAVYVLSNPSQPRDENAGPEPLPEQVPALLPLLSASQAGLPARSAANLVPVHHACVHQRSRVAGPADGCRRPRL